MHFSLPRRLIILAITFIVMTAHPIVWAETSDDLRIIEELCATAKRDRELRNYEDVERGRRKRWEILQRLATSGSAAETPLLAGFLAIRDVDGENTTADKVLDPGLVNRLKYKEACARLREAWAAMARVADGPVLGEVAVRLFEVAQQARGVYRDALDPESSNCVATLAEIKAALIEAERRDPFCIMATPLRLFLDTPDPKEAFLRAEHRKSFQQRQSTLVNISHPVVFLDKRQNDSTKDPTKPDAPSEGADKPLLPWHAAVEIDKAKSLQFLLDELDYGAYLKPDVSGPGYILPGKVVAGRDRMSDRFVLLYGRYLFCRVEDRDNALRAAVLYLDDDHKWQRRYLNLLWRTPQQDEQLPLRELVESMPVRHEFKLADNSYSVCDFPIEACEDLIAAQTQVLCVRDASQFARLRYHPVRNDVYAIKKLLSTRAYDPNDVKTTPGVAGVLQTLASVRDATKHPLVELMRDRGWELPSASGTFTQVLNPLVIVSDGDNAETMPKFFAENTPSPYLQLEDGKRLVFELNEGEGAPRCTINYPGATVAMPLHFHSVPKNLLKGGRMGAAFFQLLSDAGYTESESYNEIQTCIEKPKHIPSRFMQRLRSKMISTGIDSDSAQKAMLSEAGWQGAPFLSSEMNRLYGVYGFRYLRDQRGNWITSRRFSEDQDIVSGTTNSAASTADDSPPFDFRAQDGVGRINTTQIYSMKDYKQIKENIVKEHFNKLIRYHPAVPVVGIIRADAEKELANPSDINADSSDEIGAKIKKLKDFNRSIGEAVSLLNAGNENLLRPVPAWSTNEDKSQSDTLVSLHNAYVGVVKSFAVSTYELQLYPMLYDALAELSKAAGSSPSLTEQIGDLKGKIDTAFNSKQEEWVAKSEPVLATQLETARYFAKARLYHKAVTHYNDVLEQMFLPQRRRQGHDLFSRVVTADEAQAFGVGVEKVIRAQQMVVTAQMELAGVLNAAGLKSSAYFVWRRVADDEKYLLQPTAKIVRTIIESYGLRTSDSVNKALSSFHESAATAERAVAKHCTEPPWRVYPESDPAKKKGVTEAIGEINAYLQRLQNQRDLVDGSRISPEHERLFDRALERIDEAEALDFDTWLRYRQALLPKGEVFALRTRGKREEYTIHPVQFCPRTYDRDDGFTLPFKGMLVDTSASEIGKWCGLNDKEAFESPIAEKACFLLAWYWLDEGEKSNSRAAFMKLADILLARAEQAGEAQGKLTKKLNALSAIIGGYAIFDEVPGVKVIRSGLGAYMTPQLVHLQREWFSAGQYGPHAANECRILERHMEAIQDHAVQLSSADFAGRYFLADYTYIYGAVPNWLVVQAITSPELFKDLTAEEIKKLRGEAVEGDRWIPLREDEVSHFFNKLKLNATVDEDIVNLAK
ncbi:MAG: hypothetical protein K8S94_00200 [Planctomycetia bacterium]|nr:hypothetical protein [Planctomycetia bacterium]